MESTHTAPAQLHTVEEVMKRLRVGRSTAFGLIASRQLRSVKVGRRRLVSEAAIVEFIENLDSEAVALESQCAAPPSGRSSTISPASFSTTSVTPRADSTAP